MNARICTNPNCRTIQTDHRCSLCEYPTQPLPSIDLSPMGIKGTLHHTMELNNAHALLIHLPSGHHRISVTVSDLDTAAQPHLPNLGEASGLMIMDALRCASDLVSTKDPLHWPGWILFLLEALQDHATPPDYQQVLQVLQHDLKYSIVDDDAPEEATPCPTTSPRPVKVK